jgi:hypothetical protein
MLKIRLMLKPSTRVSAVVAIAAGLLIWSPEAARPQGDVSYEDQLTRDVQYQIEEWNLNLEAGGYRLILEQPPSIGLLLADQGRLLEPLELSVPATYLLFALCDEDCSDIDLLLYDQNGEEVDSDTAEDALPILELTIGGDGALMEPSPSSEILLDDPELTAELYMVSCQSSYGCYYAVALCKRVPVEDTEAEGADDG